MRRMNTCTREMKFGQVHTHFFVGCTIPGMHNEPCTLHVSRSYPGRMQSVTIVNDMSFANTDEAYRWAYTHGYLQDYFHRVWCPIHRECHTSGSWKDGAGYTHITYTSWCTRYKLVA